MMKSLPELLEARLVALSDWQKIETEGTKMAEILNIKPAESKGARIVVIKEPGAATTKTKIDGTGADVLGLIGVAVAGVVQLALKGGVPLNVITEQVIQMAAEGINLALTDMEGGQHEHHEN